MKAAIPTNNVDARPSLSCEDGKRRRKEADDNKPAKTRRE
jgi:hypothetical protein